MNSCIMHNKKNMDIKKASPVLPGEAYVGFNYKTGNLFV
jgi:hypothetical protein